MLYDNRIAAAFLEGRPVTEEKHFYLLQEYKEADPKRRDIVQELDSQLESIVEEFPTFNKELFEAVFPITGSSWRLSVSWRLSAQRKTAL